MRVPDARKLRTSPLVIGKAVPLQASQGEGKYCDEADVTVVPGFNGHLPLVLVQSDEAKTMSVERGED